MSYRTLSVRATTVDETNRTVEAVIASENPVPMFDYDRWEMVPEVLLISGMQNTRGLQVPLLDSHDRSSVSSQLGSVRGIQKDANRGEASGVLHFSSTAEDAWIKVREGHTTDVSAGYRIEKQRFVPANTTERIGNRDFTGPVNVATKWLIREVSVTPIGADQVAKIRGYDPDDPRRQQRRRGTMNEELRARCVAAGMDPQLDDDAALEWLNTNHSRVWAPADPPPAPPPADPPTPPPADPGRGAPPNLAAQVADELERRELERQRVRAQYETDVDACLRLAFRGDPPAELRQELLALNNLEQARQRIVDYRDTDPPVPPDHFRFSREQPQDRHRADLSTAFQLRALNGAGFGAATVERSLPQADRARGWETFRHCTLLQFADQCLQADGYQTRGLTHQQIAVAALGWPHKVGLRTRGDSAYHVTSSFAQLTRDAVNKSMLTAYTEAPATWRGPMRQGDSVPDFKTIHRVQLGQIPNLPIWPDNTVPDQASMADYQETYAVEAHGAKISFSWRLMVNDDMSALSRTPALMGDAAARTVNATAWGTITANGLLADGIALFSAASGVRKQQNLTTGAGAPSTSTVGALTALMRVVAGLNTPEAAKSSAILNLQPAYIVGPAALETTILQLVRSIADPTANMSAGVYNTASTLTPVIEPLLDSSSTTAWYLFASPSRIDTVEVTFLQGQETPVTNDWSDEETWAQNFLIVQTFEAKPLDWRGMQKHAGA